MANTNVPERTFEIHSAASKRMTEIRTNTEISEDKRTRQLARAYLDQKTAIADVRGTQNASDQATIDRIAGDIYGLPATGDSLSYRDALDRARQIDPTQNPHAIDDALELLEQARITRDDLLTRALLKTAFDAQWIDVVNAWLAFNPAKDADANRLWDLLTASRNPVDDLVATVPPPNELRRYPDSALEALAANEPLNRF